jgi:hypothetical protein
MSRNNGEVAARHPGAGRDPVQISTAQSAIQNHKKSLIFRIKQCNIGRLTSQN